MERHRNPDGTYDGVGVMSDLSGLSRADVRSIAEQVKANHAKLNACPAHDFEPLDNGHPRLRRRYRCTNCGGEVDFLAWHWHEQGRRPRPS